MDIRVIVAHVSLIEWCWRLEKGGLVDEKSCFVKGKEDNCCFDFASSDL